MKYVHYIRTNDKTIHAILNENNKCMRDTLNYTDYYTREKQSINLNNILQFEVLCSLREFNSNVLFEKKMQKTLDKFCAAVMEDLT